MKIIAIAGGSGTGKSTVSYHLVDTYPEIFEVINLDDYQLVKAPDRVPMINGVKNWDHPNAVDWDELCKHIDCLRRDETVVIDVWSHRSNPDWHIHKELRPRTITPKPIMIIEGYLALYQKLLEHYDHKYYLDLSEEARNQRRKEARQGKSMSIAADDYIEKVLNPMHKKYVEPTREHADMVIDVSQKSPQEVAELIYAEI